MERKTYTINIRIAKNPTRDYPFAVVPSVLDSEGLGKENAEVGCRSLRDSLICANGMAQGIYIADPYARVNIVWHPALEREA